MRRIPPTIKETIDILRAMAKQAHKECQEDDRDRYRAEARELSRLKE
jgi:hypothetical protein